MSELTLEKETTKLEKYLKKNNRQDFIDEIRGGSKETRDAKLLALAKHREDIKNTMAKDEDLEQAKKRYTELKKTHTDQLKTNEKLARFVALVSEEQGDN